MVDCYQCAKSGVRTTGVALCTDCNAALCLPHVREAASWTRADGSRIGCLHDTWQVVADAAAPAPAVGYLPLPDAG